MPQPERAIARDELHKPYSSNADATLRAQALHHPAHDSLAAELAPLARNWTSEPLTADPGLPHIASIKLQSVHQGDEGIYGDAHANSAVEAGQRCYPSKIDLSNSLAVTGWDAQRLRQCVSVPSGL